MASLPLMEAAARESRANAREDMAVLTSGAREKVDNAMASIQALGQTLLHPSDKKKQEEAQLAAEEQKKVAKEKRDEIRSVAAQQAATERAAARSVVAKQVSDTGGTRYPVDFPDQSQQSSSFPVVDPDYHPNHPPVVDKPLGNHLESNISPHAQEHAQELHNTFGSSDTAMAAPHPAAAFSRDSKSDENVYEGDSKGAQDADYYRSPRIVQTQCVDNKGKQLQH